MALGPAGLAGAAALVLGLWRRRLLLTLLGVALLARDLNRHRSSR
jgi:hypothetical protein